MVLLFLPGKHYVVTIQSFAVKLMFCHDDVQVANEIKSTKFRWKFTTFSTILHQTDPMTSKIKIGGEVAVWDYPEALLEEF